MDQNPQTVRSRVEEAYAERIRAATSCCGTSCTENAAMSGYTSEVEAFPEAGGSSFGCGNPLAFDGVEAGETVLDLGSGAGFDLLIAAERVGPEGRVIGVDMTDAMIEKARENIARAGASQVEVRKGLIEKLPVEDGSVDWAISNCVINLSPEKERVFAELARVLRPGGRISISDIVADELPEWAREMVSSYTGCIGGAIPERDYLAGLEKAGLVDVAVVDRIVYTPEQLATFAENEADKPRFAELAGQVASVRFVGRKS